MAAKIVWSAIALLALLVAIYSGATLVVPAFRTSFLQNIFDVTPVAISLHLAGGLVAVGLGVFQINQRLRARYITVHRWLGRLYVVAVIVGGSSALLLALNSFGGLVTHFGFGLLAVAWIGSTLNAYRHIRRGDVTAHRAWMLRSYALTLAAVTLRVYLPLSAAAGIDFEQAYQAVSWLCWVPNLMVVEWFILARTPAKPVAAGSAATD